MLPKTYLLQAPKGAKSTRSIDSADLIRGLRELNPLIRAWLQFPEFKWWPGKGLPEGTVSSLWIGEPGGESPKITAFTMGEIPEFTEVGEGRIKRKGWRAIFDKVIRSKAASKEAVELKFGVHLDYEKAPDPHLCRVCLRAGEYKNHNGGAAKLCRLHDSIREALMPQVEEMQAAGAAARRG